MHSPECYPAPSLVSPPWAYLPLCELREVYQMTSGAFLWPGHHFLVKGQSLGLPSRVHSFSPSSQLPTKTPTILE